MAQLKVNVLLIQVVYYVIRMDIVTFVELYQGFMLVALCRPQPLFVTPITEQQAFKTQQLINEQSVRVAKKTVRNI